MNYNDQVKENSKKVWGATPAGSTFGNNYDRGTKEFFDSVLEKRFSLETPWLDDVVNFKSWQHKRVLEIGCGAGYDAFQFCKYNADYVGIDITPENPIMARKHLGFYNYKPEIIEADVEKITFASEFDLIYSFGVLHHVPDIKQALHNIHTALKDNGQCIIIVYHKNSIFYWLHVVFADWILHGKFLKMSLNDRISQIEFTTSDAKPLVRVYSRRSIKSLMQQTGFAVQAIKIRKLVKEDLPDIPVIRRVYKYISQPVLDRIGNWFGWYICVRAIKR